MSDTSRCQVEAVSLACFRRFHLHWFDIGAPMNSNIFTVRETNGHMQAHGGEGEIIKITRPLRLLQILYPVRTVDNGPTAGPTRSLFPR